VWRATRSSTVATDGNGCSAMLPLRSGRGVPSRTAAAATVCQIDFMAKRVIRCRLCREYSRLFVGIARGAEGPGEFAELRRQNSRAVPAGPPFHPLQEALQRSEQGGARARDAATHNDGFRVQNVDKGTDACGQRLHGFQPD